MDTGEIVLPPYYAMHLSSSQRIVKVPASCPRLSRRSIGVISKPKNELNLPLRVRWQARNGKYGYANHKGNIVIAPIYDGAMPFEKGEAIVCNDCRSVSAPTDPEHHSFFAGGEWFRINNKGKVVERLKTGVQ